MKSLLMQPVTYDMEIWEGIHMKFTSTRVFELNFHELEVKQDKENDEDEIARAGLVNFTLVLAHAGLYSYKYLTNNVSQSYYGSPFQYLDENNKTLIDNQSPQVSDTGFNDFGDILHFSVIRFLIQKSYNHTFVTKSAMEKRIPLAIPTNNRAFYNRLVELAHPSNRLPSMSFDEYKRSFVEFDNRSMKEIENIGKKTEQHYKDKYDNKVIARKIAEFESMCRMYKKGGIIDGWMAYAQQTFDFIPVYFDDSQIVAPHLKKLNQKLIDNKPSLLTNNNGLSVINRNTLRGFMNSFYDNYEEQLMEKTMHPDYNVVKNIINKLKPDPNIVEIDSVIS